VINSGLLQENKEKNSFSFLQLGQKTTYGSLNFFNIKQNDFFSIG